MASNSCFKQTLPRPDDCKFSRNTAHPFTFHESKLTYTISGVELPAPTCSPLTNPERDDAESARTLSAGTAAGVDDGPADKAPSSRTLSHDDGDTSATLSDDDDAEIVPRPFALPNMIPESADNLCTLPTHPTRAPTEVIRARRAVPGGPELFGHEVVRRKAHLLSADRVAQRRRPHKVGVHVPWTPDALTANTAWKAHVRHAVRWARDSVRNTVTAPLPHAQDPGSEEDSALVVLPADHLVDVVAPLREISRKDVKQPFPVGPAPGEEFIIPDAPSPTTAQLQRPARPVGAFDPAERLYYRHQRRLEYLRRLMRQGRSKAEAIATVEHTVGGGVEWKKLCDEAETAEYVLRAYGKLPPLPEWEADADAAEGGDGDDDDAPAPPKPKGKRGKKPAPKGKGKGKGKAPVPAEGEVGPTCPPVAGDAEPHGPISSAAPPGDEEPVQGTKRVRRVCRPSAKAKEIEEAFADFVLDEGEGPPAPKRQRQRR